MVFLTMSPSPAMGSYVFPVSHLLPGSFCHVSGSDEAAQISGSCNIVSPLFFQPQGWEQLLALSYL